MTRPHCIGGLVWQWRPPRDVPCPQCAAAIAMALFGWLLASCCPLAPMQPEPVEPRSVAEAVGMAELALAPMAVACSRCGLSVAEVWRGTGGGFVWCGRCGHVGHSATRDGAMAAARKHARANHDCRGAQGD